MRRIKVLAALIILLRNIEGKTICYNIPDNAVQIPSVAVTVKNPKGDEIDLGDMTLTKLQYDALFSDKAFKRHGLVKAFRHWDGGIVPVKFDENADFKPDFMQRIKDAMAYIMGVSCIKFDWKNEPKKDYVFITREKRCSSNVGNMRKGQQNMYVYESCSKGNIIHEFLHALGFLHMHTAVERDKYVKIDWGNINEKSKLNFQKYTSHVSMFGTDYDYNSIMHYGPTSFAKDKKMPTIIQKIPVKDSEMGQRKKMSDGDIARLNKMYKCPAKTSSKQTIQSDGSTNMIISGNNSLKMISEKNALNMISENNSLSMIPDISNTLNITSESNDQQKERLTIESIIRSLLKIAQLLPEQKSNISSMIQSFKAQESTTQSNVIQEISERSSTKPDVLSYEIQNENSKQTLKNELKGALDDSMDDFLEDLESNYDFSDGESDDNIDDSDDDLNDLYGSLGDFEHSDSVSGSIEDE